MPEPRARTSPAPSTARPAGARGSRRAGARPLGGIPRFSDLIDASDEMVAFVETYQQVWQHESRAMIALGEFLAARADALRTQAELMRMGSDVARRYGAWSDGLLSLRPDSMMQSWMQTMQRATRSGRDE